MKNNAKMLNETRSENEEALFISSDTSFSIPAAVSDTESAALFTEELIESITIRVKSFFYRLIVKHTCSIICSFFNFFSSSISCFNSA